MGDRMVELCEVCRENEIITKVGGLWVCQNCATSPNLRKIATKEKELVGEGGLSNICGKKEALIKAQKEQARDSYIKKPKEVEKMVKKEEEITLEDLEKEWEELKEEIEVRKREVGELAEQRDVRNVPKIIKNLQEAVEMTKRMMEIGDLFKDKIIELNDENEEITKMLEDIWELAKEAGWVEKK